MNAFDFLRSIPNLPNSAEGGKIGRPSNSELRIKVYNILGKEIKELLNETRLSGEYEIIWDGTDNLGSKVSSGVYFITMSSISNSSGEAGSYKKTIKAILIK